MCMKTTAAILASVILGLTAPVSAHAQLTGKMAARLGLMDMPQQGQGRGGRDRDNDERPQPRPQIERPEAPMRLVQLNQVVSQIQRSIPGQLLDASGPSGGSRPVYRIRWQAASGQRIDFTVDAQTGAILGRSGG